MMILLVIQLEYPLLFELFEYPLLFERLDIFIATKLLRNMSQTVWIVSSS